MNDLSTLGIYLLDLLWELRDTDLPIIIGGGYGIFLKTEYVRTHHLRTLLDKRPESRSTSDLDLFLRPELLIEPKKLAPLAKAIERLGYIVIPTAQKYQFVKPGPGNVGEIKIDLLTATAIPIFRFQRKSRPTSCSSQTFRRSSRTYSR